MQPSCLDTISYLGSSSVTAHAGLTRRATAVSRPLVKGNEDAGYEGGLDIELHA